MGKPAPSGMCPKKQGAGTLPVIPRSSCVGNGGKYERYGSSPVNHTYGMGTFAVGCST